MLELTKFLVYLLAIPLGFALAHLTREEKGIYLKSPYFPIIIPTVFIAAVTFIFFDMSIAKTLFFVGITLLIWEKA